MLASEVIVGQGQDLRGFSWWGDAATFEDVLEPEQLVPGRDVQPILLHQSASQPPLHQLRRPRFRITTGHAAATNGGVNVAMADDSVRFVKNSISVWTWRAMSTTRGDEVVSADQY